jgi:hypothetical protein
LVKPYQEATGFEAQSALGYDAFSINHGVLVMLGVLNGIWRVCIYQVRLERQLRREVVSVALNIGLKVSLW